MSPERRRLVAVLATLVLVALVVLAVVALPGDGEEAERVAVGSVAQDRPGTVLLVPGYGGSTSALEVLAARLQSAGRATEVVELPGEGTDDLTGYTSLVDDAAQRALRAGAPSVDVVGFSAGGVVTRLWARQGGAAVTRRVVTLGSPHHGTDAAATGAVLAPDRCPRACRQLVPGSELLDDLNDGDETPDGPQWLTLWTTVDETVTPPDSARLEGATQVVLQELCPQARTSHGDLPRDRRVQGVVLAALSAGPVVVPAGCPT